MERIFLSNNKEREADKCAQKNLKLAETLFRLGSIPTSFRPGNRNTKLTGLFLRENL